MSRISRKELKKDEFAAEVSKTYEFIQQQREKLLRVGVAAAVVVVLAMGAYFLVQYRKSRADEELAHAVRVFYAPLQSESPDPQEINFPDDGSRYAQAEKEFGGIAGKYSWVRQGRMARYYLGLSKLNLGKTDEAIRDLQAVAGRSEENLASLAKFALAGAYAGSGKTADAEKLYRELANRPTETVPKDSALLALADHLSASKPAEAQKIYQELQKQQGKSSAAEIAGQRLAELKK